MYIYIYIDNTGTFFQNSYLHLFIIKCTTCSAFQHHKHLTISIKIKVKVKVKVIPQQAEVAQGVLGRLRSRIFLTFGTTWVVGSQPYAPAAFTPGEIPGTHFQRLSRPQGTWFHWWQPRKKSPVTSPGIDPGTVQRVAQCLNHYTTPNY